MREGSYDNSVVLESSTGEKGIEIKVTAFVNFEVRQFEEEDDDESRGVAVSVCHCIRVFSEPADSAEMWTRCHSIFYPPYILSGG